MISFSFSVFCFSKSSNLFRQSDLSSSLIRNFARASSNCKWMFSRSRRSYWSLPTESWIPGGYFTYFCLYNLQGFSQKSAILTPLNNHFKTSIKIVFLFFKKNVKYFWNLPYMWAWSQPRPRQITLSSKSWRKFIQWPLGQTMHINILQIALAVRQN